MGRDVFARLLYGGRFSLLLTVVALFIAGTLCVGTILGGLAGFLGGLLDEALMRLVDLLIVFPGIVIALVIAALLKPSFGTLLLALTITSWTPYARLARALTLDVKTQPYLEAAQAVAVSQAGILSRQCASPPLGGHPAQHHGTNFSHVLPPLWAHAAHHRWTLLPRAGSATPHARLGRDDCRGVALHAACAYFLTCAKPKHLPHRAERDIGGARTDVDF